MRFGICKIKNAVAELYTAIESTVNTPDDEHYAAALNTAVCVAANLLQRIRRNKRFGGNLV